MSRAMVWRCLVNRVNNLVKNNHKVFSIFVEGVKVGFRDITDGPEQGDLMQRIEAALEDPC